MKRLKFAGWVPTITGELSFSLIGLRGTPRSVAANDDCLEPGARAPVRRVLVSQKRVTMDVPWPLRLALPQRIKEYILVGATRPAVRPILSGKSGRIGHQSDDIGVLEGRVLVIPHHDDRDLNRRARKARRQIRALIGAYRSQRGPTGAQGITELAAAVDDVVSRARGHGVRILQVEFWLYRTGEVRIESPEDWRALAHQVYYFVKDVAHRHYHHDPSTDTILPLTEVIGHDDAGWRRETLWSLARAVLEARRRDRLVAYKGALGVMAYADAFQGLLGQIKRTRRPSPTPFARNVGMTAYDFNHTRASLEAKIAEREHEQDSTDQFWALALTTVLATTALWIGAVDISGPLCGSLDLDDACMSPPSWAAHFLKYLVEAPPAGFFALAAIFLLYGWRRLSQFPIVRHYIRWLEAWSQAVGATASAGIGLLPQLSGDRLGKYFAAAAALLFGIGTSALIARLTGLL